MARLTIALFALAILACSLMQVKADCTLLISTGGETHLKTGDQVCWGAGDAYQECLPNGDWKETKCESGNRCKESSWKASCVAGEPPKNVLDK